SIVLSGEPLTDSVSDSAPSANSTDILVHNASSVSDRDPAAGRLAPVARLPQYFTSAIFGCATAWARICSFQGGVIRVNPRNHSSPCPRFVARQAGRPGAYGCSLVRRLDASGKTLARDLRRKNNRLQQTYQ